MRLPTLFSATATIAWAAVVLAAPCAAQSSSDVRGIAFIAGKTLVDAPPGEPKNSHAYLQLTGAAALQMYRNMRAREQRNACEPGKKLKRAGSLTCSLNADGRSASCDFSVDLIKGTLNEGRPC